MMLTVRAARADDREAIWAILEPVIRAGDTYTLPRQMSRDEALAYWNASGHEVFVAEEDGHVIGTYFCAPIRRVAGRTWPVAATSRPPIGGARE